MMIWMVLWERGPGLVLRTEGRCVASFLKRLCIIPEKGPKPVTKTRVLLAAMGNMVSSLLESGGYFRGGGCVALDCWQSVVEFTIETFFWFTFRSVSRAIFLFSSEV